MWKKRGGMEEGEIFSPSVLGKREPERKEGRGYFSFFRFFWRTGKWRVVLCAKQHCSISCTAISGAPIQFPAYLNWRLYGTSGNFSLFSK